MTLPRFGLSACPAPLIFLTFAVVAVGPRVAASQEECFWHPEEVAVVAPDESWSAVEVEHPDLPVRFYAPSELVFSTYPNELAVLYIASAGERDQFATLQIGADRIRSPEDFVSGVSEIAEVESTELVGTLLALPARVLCATLVEELPRVYYENDDGSMSHTLGGPQTSIVRSYYLVLGAITLRATYRMPEGMASEWVPVFEAVIGSLEWTSPP